MDNHYTSAGMELLNLLRQQRYLYHELRNLTLRKQQLANADSPELMLEVINGRRKLTEKLREINNKLRVVKGGWHKLLSQIEPKHMTEANEIAEQIKQIVTSIQDVKTSRTSEQPPVYQELKSDESFAEIYS